MPDAAASAPRGAHRRWHIAAAVAIALIAFACAFAPDWRLPGLYMDAINPEYIIPGLLDPSAPGHKPWILPGNAIDGRFPLFTGTLYHGSTQLYFALPWMLLFGVDIGSLRFTQALVGALIVALIALLASRSRNRAPVVAAFASGVLLALDPSFVLALRTQAYSCLFPLVMLLGSTLLLIDPDPDPDPDRRLRGALRLAASGILFGLAAFSYFIFAFFAPALIALALYERPRANARFPARNPLLIWLPSTLLGWLPFLIGLRCIENAVHGWHPLVRWLRGHGQQLHVLGESDGLVGHVTAVLGDARSVLTGKWPWLMMLGHHAGDALGSLKAGVLIGLPLATFLVLRRSGVARDAIGIPLTLAFVFLAVATIFGERLDGHHYTAILPLFYAAFGGACALLWQRAATPEIATFADRAPRGARAGAAIAVVAALIVAGANIANLVHFHDDLRASGGYGLYSDAIDRFALDVAHHDADATVYLPDWGYVMPFVFLTRARVAQFDNVDPLRMRREACAGKAQIVLLSGAGNAPKFALVAKLAHLPIADIRAWNQRDGVPVFETMRFAPANGCVDDEGGAIANPTLGADDARAAIAVEPESAYDCPYLAPFAAHVGWRTHIANLDAVDVSVSTAAGGSQLWTRGAAIGGDTTGYWAVPGMRFTLTVPDTGETLATTTIEKVDCPAR